MSGSAWWWIVAAASTVGCVPEYRPPLPNEPHAILKVRRVYEQNPGTGLHEKVLVDEYLALSADEPAGVAAAPRTDAILIRPVPATISVSNSFYHLATRAVEDTYFEEESYQDTETYNCGVGTEFRTCTRSVTRYRSVPRTRWVDRIEPQVDGACERGWRLAPAAGRTYLLQYTYQEHGACSLSCFEQVPTGAGQFEHRPCPTAPAAGE
jgi:hypothetical protein